MATSWPSASRTSQLEKKIVRPPPVRVEIHRILGEVLDGNASSSLLLDRLRTRGERDRSLATEVVFGVLRRLAALDHHIERLAQRHRDSVIPAGDEQRLSPAEHGCRLRCVRGARRFPGRLGFPASEV